MKKQHSILAVIVILVLALAGWQLGWFSGAGSAGTAATSTSADTSTSTSKVSPSQPAMPVGMGQFDGTSYRIVSYDSVPVPAGEEYAVSFKNGVMQAKICNSFSGGYSASGGVFDTRLSSTMMACTTPADTSIVEQVFSTVLGSGTTYSWSGDTLALYGRGHTIILKAN